MKKIIDSYKLSRLSENRSFLDDVINGGRPRKMDAHTIKMAMAAMSDRNSVIYEGSKRLNVTTTTLYTYVNKDGSQKEADRKLLHQSTREKT